MTAGPRRPDVSPGILDGPCPGLISLVKVEHEEIFKRIFVKALSTHPTAI